MNRGKPAAAAIPMSERHYGLLVKESHKRTISVQYVDRIGILLKASPQGGGLNNSQIKRDLSISLNTVKTWRLRWTQHYCRLSNFEMGQDNKGVSDHELVCEMLNILEDLPRSGAPKTISLSQQEQIVALACEEPSQFGLPITNWTHEMLAQVAINQDIVKTISSRYVGTLLKKKPTSTA